MPASKHLNGIATIGPIKTLEKIARVYEEKAATLRHAIDLFLEARGHGKRSTAPATLDAAIEIDRERRSHHKKPKSGRPGYGSRAAVEARRAATLEYLDQFSTDKPLVPSHTGPGGVRVGPLLRNGYLKKRGAKGFVRTAKPFTIEKPDR